ncbi:MULTISPECIES: sensor domain-containing diguanylate cyclase [unclassified Marinobacter]|uniref:sensor domain-containing diguanylate cyclase n=1 Tax=unclassified Marinobacter TaxID=83889 RepID=UPI001267E13A|nr:MULTISPECIES: diguanylate cyclase [unclassified Marinobacter]QFS85267.1 Phytochrome-like protein cph2 [Marinobacter sp. THAF197a]QFT49061.1 Phytochrome-like protein cph2 [Marinobacter sp. THAF39]
MKGPFPRTICQLFGLLLCVVSFRVFAEPVGFDWVEVPEDNLTVTQVQQLPDSQWQYNSAARVLNQGFSNGAFWLRVPITPEPVNRVLEIAYPLLDEVSVYWELDGQIVESHHTGDTRPFDTRPIIHRNFVFLVPSNTEPVIAWVRVKTQGAVQVPMAVTTSARFLANEQFSYGWQAMFLGIVVALSFYNLFLFVIVRHTTYLWYVLTVISTGMIQLNFNGLLFQWIWPDLPGLNRYFTVPAISLGMFCAVMFTIKFLAVRHYSLFSYRILQGVIGACSFTFFYGVFGPYQSGIALVSGIAAFATPAAWLIGLYVWRQGQVLAGFYVLAWTPLLVGHLVLAVSKLGWIPTSQVTELVPQAGVAIEAILLSFALAYRINMERRRRQEAQEHALKVQQQANLTLEARVRERTEELERANEQLKAISLTDGLTHVANRRRFDEKLEIEWGRALRHEHELSLLLLDIDHFKRVNDELGHLTGDDCLVALAGILQAEVQRAGDLVARYGGEEFAILLPTTDSAGALLVAERIRKAVAGTPVATKEQDAPVPLTISVGVATMLPARGVSSPELVRRADEALYAAKDNGRNRVAVWQPKVPAPTADS